MLDVLKSLAMDVFRLSMKSGSVSLGLKHNTGNPHDIIICFMIFCCCGVARIPSLSSLQVIISDRKGQSKGSGKPLLYILSFEKTGDRGRGG